jgi:hypothetical protein
MSSQGKNSILQGAGFILLNQLLKESWSLMSNLWILFLLVLIVVHVQLLVLLTLM